MLRMIWDLVLYEQFLLEGERKLKKKKKFSFLFFDLKFYELKAELCRKFVIKFWSRWTLFFKKINSSWKESFNENETRKLNFAAFVSIHGRQQGNFSRISNIWKLSILDLKLWALKYNFYCSSSRSFCLKGLFFVGKKSSNNIPFCIWNYLFQQWFLWS